DLQRLRDGKLAPRPKPALKPADVNRAQMTTWERGEMVRDALLNVPNPVVTRILFAANILVFVYGMYLAKQQQVELNLYLAGSLFGGQGRNIPQEIKYQEVLIRIGALTPVGLLNGQWWRLITNCFVHIGFLHVLVNMVALYRAGPLIE